MKIIKVHKIKRVIKLLFGRVVENEMEEVKKHRHSSERKITRMIADINGCTDSWFLSPNIPLDECIERDNKDKK